MKNKKNPRRLRFNQETMMNFNENNKNAKIKIIKYRI
jgi:hypothetical protein